MSQGSTSSPVGGPSGYAANCRTNTAYDSGVSPYGARSHWTSCAHVSSNSASANRLAARTNFLVFIDDITSLLYVESYVVDLLNVVFFKLLFGARNQVRANIYYLGSSAWSDFASASNSSTITSTRS